jgi:uncharacterized protein
MLPKKIIKISVGIGFIILGVISGFLPVLQGWIFNLVGVVLLAEEIPFLNKYLKRAEQKYPKQFEAMYRFRRDMKQKIMRLFRRKTNDE